MESNERYTLISKFRDYDKERISHIYFSKRETIELYTRLGQYEDLGYTPTELADVLIKYEMTKGINAWDMNKVQYLEDLKEQFEYDDQRVKEFVEHHTYYR